jgi:hypothetical protein
MGMIIIFSKFAGLGKLVREVIVNFVLCLIITPLSHTTGMEAMLQAFKIPVLIGG